MGDFLSTSRSRRDFLKTVTIAGIGIGLEGSPEATFMAPLSQQAIRVGIIGFSVHSADFTKILNAKTAGNEFGGCSVVAIHHPEGNKDVEFSAERLADFRKVAVDHGVELVGSIKAVLERVDAVMVLTNDGRPHLEQLIPVFEAGKPVYVDKPLAADLAGVLAIFEASKKYGVPVFSSSALRYVKQAQEIGEGSVVGNVLGAETHGPAPLQASHVDLFWDGIHGVESLYTVMGTGCKWVTCAHTKGADVVTGTWLDERVGVFRGLRKGKIGFGGTAYGSDGIAAIGPFGGYGLLVAAIADFFRTRKAPVSREETVEIYTFMAAAEESKRRGGIPVQLASVLSEAQRRSN